jgi:adenylate cyclase
MHLVILSRTTLFKLTSRLITGSLLLLFLAYAGHWLNIPVFDRLENVAYDLRLRATMPNSQDSRIVIIDIDELSLAREGRWPWSRDKLAALTDKLCKDYQVATLGFDMIFSEPDNSSGITWFTQLAQGELADDSSYQKVYKNLQPHLAYDAIFAASLKNQPVVLGVFSMTEELDIGADNALPSPVSQALGFAEFLPLAKSFGANLRVLQEAAVAGGFFNNPMVDQDGVFRRVPLLVEYQSALYPSLSLAIYQRYLAQKSLEFITDRSDEATLPTLEGIKLLDYIIPTDQHSAILVPYRGRQGSFKYYSATEVLHGKLAKEQLAGKIAILGTTAAGLMDLRSTPVQNIYPGVEVHANIISALLDHTIKSKPAYMLGFEMLEMLSLGLIASFFWSRLSPAAGFILFAALSILIVVVNFYLWQQQNIDTKLFLPLLLLSLLFISQVSLGYLLESRRKNHLSKIFSQYIPPELVSQMVKSDDRFNLAGESRELTVLFTDVRGFTSISEQMQPEALSELMNQILTPITRLIHQHQGTIDKYMGDAVMAFWGAPLQDAKHAKHAVEAALAILQALAEINQQFQARGWPKIKIGVGLNTGQMSVGNMGSSFRMAYTVLGDAVNLGSRLEGISKQYGVSIIVSESTKAQASEFLYRELDRVRVKGKQEPISIFEPLGLIAEMDASQIAEVEKSQQALHLYWQRDWLGAQALFRQLSTEHPDTQLYQLYLQRIADYLLNTPALDWDGVYTHTSK